MPVHADLLASVVNPRALALHLRVQRWTLDESPLPARLFEDVVELLYRHDELMRGVLEIGGEPVSPGRVTAPLLPVVNPTSRIIRPRRLCRSTTRRAAKASGCSLPGRPWRGAAARRQPHRALRPPRPLAADLAWTAEVAAAGDAD